MNTLTQMLNSPDEYKREKAMDMLGESRAMVANHVRENLNVALKERPSDMKDFGSSFNMVCRVIGQWRIEEATGSLLPYIDSTLDPTSFRVGATFGRDAYYPAAAALVKIRSSNLRRQLLDLFAAPIDEKKLQVATWMLQQSNGNEVAQFIVERELADYERKMEDPKILTSVRKNNLLKVLELLKAKDGVELPR